jgi:hypothetical protein
MDATLPTMLVSPEKKITRRIMALRLRLAN